MPHIVKYLSGYKCIHTDEYPEMQRTLPEVGNKRIKFGTVEYTVKKVTTDRLATRPITWITFIGLLSIYPLSASAAPWLLADVTPAATECAVYVDAKAKKIVPIRLGIVTSCAFDLAGSVSGTRKIVFAPIVNGVEQPKLPPRNVLSTLKNTIRYFSVAEVACSVTGCVRDDLVQAAVVVSN